MEKHFKDIMKDIKEGVYGEPHHIGPVQYYLIEKTGYSFHFYAIKTTEGKKIFTELLYDLRNKKYFIKRNGREVKFSTQNLDTVIPRKYLYSSGNNFHSREGIESFLTMVSVEENKGMYKKMLEAIGKLGEEVAEMTSRAFIRLITDYHKLELLYKAGINLPGTEDMSAAHMRRYASNKYYNTKKFYKMVFDAGTEEVRKVHQVFGLTKSQLKFARDVLNNNIYQIMDVYRPLQALTQQDMDRYRGYATYIEEMEEKYDITGRLELFQEQATLEHYAKAIQSKRENTRNNGYDIFTFIENKNISNPLRLIEYLLFECFLSQGFDYVGALQEYTDYYSMCMDLEYENFDKYPRYLKTSHDIVSMNYNLVADEMTNKKFAEATKYYKHLEDTVGDFAIVVPNETVELVNEGNVLHHCVGSYVRNVSEGTRQIMFLRDKKEQELPLVTVEVRDGEIVQARGFGNRSLFPEEAQALRKFAKKKNVKVKAHI